MELNSTQFLTALISAVSLYYPESGNPDLQPRDTPQTGVLPEYDFIIVGAGSAGCVVANRLSENPKWKILLIEAGGDEDIISDVPHLHFQLRNTDKDWNYTTVRQKRACLSTGGVCKFTSGHVMGGSSTINGMMYVRGHEVDFNEWEIAGNIGWSYKDVLPYFIKAENASETIFQNKLNGNKGYLNIEYGEYKTIIGDKLIEAGKELGLKEGDYNTDTKAGVARMQLTVDGPSRESSSRAYLNPMKERNNIHILKQTTVSKILIDKSKAIGVEYYHQRKKYAVKTIKEVIISSGGVGTPKLLKLSGIGPKAELHRHNIPLKADLPVGEDLQDHLSVSLYFEIKKNISTTTEEWKTNNSIYEYAINKTGPLTHIGAEVISFLNVLNRNEPPNIQVMWFTRIPNMKRQNKNLIVAIITNIQPQSRGKVKLQTDNWSDPPLIDPNYLDKEEDFQIMKKGCNKILNYMKTPTMKELSAKLHKEYHPKCKRVPTTNGYIKCIINNYSVSLYHPVGTAKMGKVVTPELLVKDFDNLRVIDASVIPAITRGNTNAPAIMVGEKGADMIVRYYKSNNSALMTRN